MPRRRERARIATWWVAGLALAAVAAAVVSSLLPATPMDRTAPGASSENTRPEVVGNLDLVRDGPSLTIGGWASRRDDGTTTIVVLGDGEEIGRTQTGRLRPDVGAAYGDTGRDAGFTVSVSAPSDAGTVCADALGADGRAVRIGCRGLGNGQPISDDLDDLVDDLATTAEREIAGYRIAIAVIPLSTGDPVGHRVDELFISASAAKSWWTAAALANGERAAAAEHAAPVFEVSDDFHAGDMIDLAGGIDAVNAFTKSLGMEDTAAMKWGFGQPRRSADWPGPLNGSNYTTARDAAWFVYTLATNQVLAPGLTDQLLTWMRASPRSAEESPPGWGSTIPDSLPAEVQAEVAHKAGWLEPFRYRVDAHLLDAGVVETADGDAYAIALLGAGPQVSARYTRLTRFFEHASCAVYVHLSGDDWACPGW